MGTSEINTRVQSRLIGRPQSTDKYLKEKESLFGTTYKGTVKNAIFHGIRIVVWERLMNNSIPVMVAFSVTLVRLSNAPIVKFGQYE